MGSFRTKCVTIIIIGFPRIALNVEQTNHQFPMKFFIIWLTGKISNVLLLKRPFSVRDATDKIYQTTVANETETSRSISFSVLNSWNFSFLKRIEH